MNMQTVLPRIAAHIDATFGIKPQIVSNHSWVKAVGRRIEETGCENAGAYLNLLLRLPAEGQQLVEGLVVSETWFFRDRMALDFLVTHIRAQEVLGRHKAWHILSLGCATGEEAYSIGMALIDGGISPTRFSVEGIDLNGKAIRKAQQGIYGANSFRTQVTLLHRGHFHRLGEDRFSVDYNVRSRVSFQQANIFTPQFTVGRRKYDVIFCRNMLIYFKPAMQAKALQVCRDLLEKEGVLVVGPTENEIARQAGFDPIGTRLSCAFKIMRAEPSVQAKQPAKLFAQPPEAKVSPETDFAKAMRLANEGLIEESLALCQRHLDASGPTPEVFFLMGTLELASRHLEQAEEYFSRTIYLEPGHYEGLINLALLAERRGDAKAANLYWMRAKKHAI